MTRAVHRVRAARTDYECAWACGRPIRRGDRHVVASLPPNTPPNDDPKWWTIRVHGHTREACPSWTYDEVDPRVEAAERPDLAPQRVEVRHPVGDVL